MTQSTKNKLPRPLYAAAGAGDLVYQKLRKVPTRTSELREKAIHRRDVLREKTIQRRDVLREKTHASQVKAAAFYKELVARGVRLIGEKR